VHHLYSTGRPSRWAFANILVIILNSPLLSSNKLEMWAKAQRDGHPAEHRWHYLFNAAKFG